MVWFTTRFMGNINGKKSQKIFLWCLNVLKHRVNMKTKHSCKRNSTGKKMNNKQTTISKISYNY